MTDYLTKGWIAIIFMWIGAAVSFYDNPLLWHISVIVWVISFGAWCYFTYKLMRGEA